MPYANNKGAEQPAHPLNLISIFVVRCLELLLISLASIFAISSLQHSSVAEQAEDRFSPYLAHMQNTLPESVQNLQNDVHAAKLISAV